MLSAQCLPISRTNGPHRFGFGAATVQPNPEPLMLWPSCLVAFPAPSPPTTRICQKNLRCLRCIISIFDRFASSSSGQGRISRIQGRKSPTGRIRAPKCPTNRLWVPKNKAVLKGPDFFFVKDRPKGPPTANRQLPPTANRHQPPTATNHQPATAANRHQPPITNCQLPPTAANRRQPPTANRQSPPTMVEHMSYTGSFLKKPCSGTVFFYFFR